MMRLISALSLLLLFTGGLVADDTQPVDVASSINEDDWEPFLPLIEKFSADYPAEREFATVSIGISHADERRYWQVGPPVVVDGEAVQSENTIYQIGSITKTFTALLLADMVEKGLVSLDTTLSELVPDDLELDESTAGITLRELATHTSGLPRLPGNMLFDNIITPGDPYSKYTPERLWAGLESTVVVAPDEREYAYSNLGMGLLGQLLAERLATDYASLLKTRITDPLQMADTVIALSEAQQTRMALGHSASGDECGVWTFDALAGCGALNSTTEDLLTYLESQLKPHDGPLGDAMRLSQQTHYEVPEGGPSLGLAWHKLTVSGPHPMILHDGGTSGYVSFAGFIPETETAVVILCNSGDALSSNHMVGALGVQLLDASQSERVDANSVPEISSTIEEEPLEEN